MASSLRWAVEPVDHDPFASGEPREAKATPAPLPELTEDDKRVVLDDRLGPSEETRRDAQSFNKGSERERAGSAEYEALRDYDRELAVPGEIVSQGGILPVGFDSEGRAHLDWDAGLVGAVRRSLALPGDVATGKVDPTSAEGLGRAAEMAATLGMGGSVMPKPEGSFGIFGGAGARGVNKALLDDAKVAHVRGVPGEETWGKTGWFKDKDGKWKFEIPDQGAEFHPELNRGIPKGNSYRLGDAFHHAGLYEAYPQLADMRLAFDLEGSNYGLFDPSTRTIHINPGISPELQKSTVLHEAQHAVQLHEGFAYGGSPEQLHPELVSAVEQSIPIYQRLLEKAEGERRWKRLFPRWAIPSRFKMTEKEAEDFAELRKIYDRVNAKQQANHSDYSRLAGEVEARNVSARANLPEEDLGLFHPDSTADVSPSDRIVRFADGSAFADSAAPQPLAPHPDWHPDARAHLLTEKAWFDRAEGPEGENSKALAEILAGGPKAALPGHAQGHFSDALRVHHGAAGPSSLPVELGPFLRRLHETKEWHNGQWVSPEPQGVPYNARHRDLLEHVGYSLKDTPGGAVWTFPEGMAEPGLGPQARDHLNHPAQESNIRWQQPGMATTPETRLQSVLDWLPATSPELQGMLTEHLARADMNLPEWHQQYFGGYGSPRAVTFMPSGEPGQLEIFGGLEGPKGEKLGTMSRILEGNTAHHEYLELEPSEQGAGAAKKILAGQVGLYEKMGLNQVKLFANVDVGGYAWAKYGFEPSQKAWDWLKKSSLLGRYRKVGEQLSPEVRAEVNKVLLSKDPKSIWKLSDLTTPVTAPRPLKDGELGPVETMPLGKYLLLQTSWHGTLDLKHAPSMERFNAYTGRKPPAGRGN